MGQSGRVGIPETVAAMNTVLTVGVLTICASALVAAATMRWGLLFASLTALVVGRGPYCCRSFWTSKLGGPLAVGQGGAT